MTRRRNFKGRTDKYASRAGSVTQQATELAQAPRNSTDEARLSPTPAESRLAPLEPVAEPDAVASARLRLEEQRRAVGEHHPDYATGLNQLAMLLIMHGQPDQSEPLLRQALAVRQEVLGERHPDYATNLSSLAGLLWARGDLDGAEPLMRQALDIRWDVLGGNHTKTKTTLNSLEQLLRAKRDWEGADRLASDRSQPVAPVAPAPAPEPGTASPPDAATAQLSDSAESPPPPVPVSEGEPAEAIAVEPQHAEPEETPKAPPVIETVADEPEVPSATSPPLAPRRKSEGVAARSRLELIGRHEQLAAQFVRVSEQLAQEAEEWKAGGAPPSADLIAALDACGRDFEQFQDEVVGLADALGTELDSSELANLEEISRQLERLSEAEGRQAQREAIRGQALAVLDRVLSLASSNGTISHPLADCQANAQAVRDTIATAPVLALPDDATQLAEGEHPFQALLALVEGDGLSDDLWADSLEVVERSFGKGLAVAVARSKIVQP